MNEDIGIKRLNSAFGSLFFLMGAVLACLVFVDHWTSISLGLPEIWYRSRSFHVVICLVLFAAGWWAHRHGRVLQDSTLVLFESVRVFTRPNCDLCDRAAELISEFGPVFPPVVFVNITQSQELTRLHGEHIPVVEIDGRIRFRGLVSTELLSRLVDAKRRQLAARQDHV